MGWLEISILGRWLIGWALALRLPELPPGVPRQHRRLSVLIPARNEAATLPHLLAALAAQRLQPDEVIVIDDDSSDDTAAIARATAGELPIRVIQPPPLPAEWCGKPWALHHGVGASTGELLLFLDADTEPGPECVERLLARHEAMGGLVSVQPYHRTEKPYEQLSSFPPMGIPHLLAWAKLNWWSSRLRVPCQSLEPALRLASLVGSDHGSCLLGAHGGSF